MTQEESMSIEDNWRGRKLREYAARGVFAEWEVRLHPVEQPVLDAKNQNGPICSTTKNYQRITYFIQLTVEGVKCQSPVEAKISTNSCKDGGFSFARRENALRLKPKLPPTKN